MAIIFMAGCTCIPKNQCPSSESSEAPTMITAKVGEEFDITLDSNPTTGYQWKLFDNSSEGIVKLLGSEYNPTEPQRIGGGGKEIWKFKAAAAGKTTITMEYVSPWEKDKPPAKKVSYEVIITNSANTQNITETKVIHYVPTMPLPNGIEVKSGSCWCTSLTAPRKDAWRCMVGSEIFDPCFSIEGGKYVVYQGYPTTDTPDFLIKLTKPLPKPELSPGEKNYGWIIELANGTLTSFMTGATALVDGKRVNYDFSEADSEETVAIVGELRPGKVWTAEKVTLGRKEPGPNDDGWFVIKSEIVPLRTVWQ